MPTFHTTSTRAEVSGSLSIARIIDDRGTTVDYSGPVNLNGRPLLSPRQLLRHWESMRQMCVDDADHCADPKNGHGPADVLRSEGLVAAYDLAIAALTSTPAVAHAVTVLEAALSDGGPPGGDQVREAAMRARGERLLAALRRTASVTWIDDEEG